MFATSSPVVVALTPAKQFASKALIPCPMPLSHSSGFSAKPVSISFTCSLAYSPTHKHVYPDPIPEFAESETLKFKTELFRRLSEDLDEFGDDLDQVVAVCAQLWTLLNMMEVAREFWPIPSYLISQS